MRNLWRTVGVLCAGVLFCHCSTNHWFGGAAVSAEPVTIEEKDVPLEVPTTLIPVDTTTVQFSQELKIEQVFVNTGDTVNVGDPLLRLSGEALALQLTQLRAQEREAELLLDKNNFFYRNRDQLLGDGKIDKTQYDGLENEVRSTEATIDRMKANIALLESQTNNTTIASPIAGVVTEKNASSGVPSPANQILLKVVKVDPINASFSLSASEADAVVIGTNVELTLEDIPNKTFSGSISYVAPELNTATKAFDVWASIANTNRVLKSGMKGVVKFISATKRRMLFVPKESLIIDGDRSFVFIVHNGRAYKKRVYTQSTADDPVEITDGLSPNDIVIVKGSKQIQDGATVDVWK